jgi:hypothetical protein
MIAADDSTPDPRSVLNASYTTAENAGVVYKSEQYSSLADYVAHQGGLVGVVTAQPHDVVADTTKAVNSQNAIATSNGTAAHTAGPNGSASGTASTNANVSFPSSLDLSEMHGAPDMNKYYAYGNNKFGNTKSGQFSGSITSIVESKIDGDIQILGIDPVEVSSSGSLVNIGGYKNGNVDISVRDHEYGTVSGDISYNVKDKTFGASGTLGGDVELLYATGHVDNTLGNVGGSAQFHISSRADATASGIATAKINKNGVPVIDIGGYAGADVAAVSGQAQAQATIPIHIPLLNNWVIIPSVQAEGHLLGLGASATGGFKTYENGLGGKAYVGIGFTDIIGGQVKFGLEVKKQ